MAQLSLGSSERRKSNLTPHVALISSTSLLLPRFALPLTWVIYCFTSGKSCRILLFQNEEIEHCGDGGPTADQGMYKLPTIEGMYTNNMKCEVSGSPPCRRCKQNQVQCVFKPRANASAIHGLIELQQDANLAFLPGIAEHQSILNRLARVEAALGISEREDDEVASSHGKSPEEEVDSAPLQGVWKAVAQLRIMTRSSSDESVWSQPIVKQLWSSFLNNLPLLHFLKSRDVFARPTPLLLASVLYISALHHPSLDLASLEKTYFAATCRAIAELVAPSLQPFSSQTTLHEDDQHDISSQSKTQTAFHNILGLIMASLSSEAYIDATGMWISMAYRIWLDHCPAEMNATMHDWRGLFSGLQVIDIEHASMHMSYPLVPRHAPAPGIQRLDSHQGNAFQGLAEMMHYGLSHFVGRGLPTIWASINTNETDIITAVRTPFTENDSQVIRVWARKLDDWLVRYNGSSQPTPSDRQGILILLQYHLHKLYVLSIYHPARGFDLSSTDISSVERHELLVSARAVLRLREDDASIWSNWDLVMITWAAILLLRGVEDGMTHQDDLHLIQSHLQSLERTNQSAASIHTVLFRRLESSMQAMHTPPDTSAALALPGPIANESWTIFDQEIMALANPPWLFDENSVQYDFTPQAQWDCAEQDAGALPSTLNRIFGADENGQNGSSSI
ncbi:uncharacterized protein N7511_009607 [Penicillium nucicola]|uniref:uncharacterized protein n=1 Tax=Penicillium nucicola TaxID=1850975 RepID=UPI002544EC66|nr:uncharacterized protein N7511_009607 [Penicillium nucicola]KAJ5747911.1 hypothetical protein N7511_009607 [Penicillium nucicola]